MWLTRATFTILQEMVAAERRDDLVAAEIVCEGVCYLGDRRIHPGSVRRLLIMTAISDCSDGGKLERYRLNEMGRAIVRRPQIVQEIGRAIYERKPFTVKDDRIVPV